MDDSAKGVSALKESSSHNIPSAVASSMPTNTNTKEEAPGGRVKEEDKFLQELNVPTVVLDTPSISHTMAAGLSLSLLSHTLFLKSQVPFPVAQLLRMPGGGSNPKVARKREELLATFDTLSSHLQTTFVALSTAYAKCKSAKRKASTVPSDENSAKESQVDPGAMPQRRAAHLMFILGPSAGAARARILLTIDGLEVKVWGQRPDTPREELEEIEGDTSIDIEDTDEEEEDSVSEGTEDEELSVEDEDDFSEDGSVATEDQEDELDELDSDTDSVPPASRSPSPDPPTRSLAPSPESRTSPRVSLKPLPDSAPNLASSSLTPTTARPVPPPTSSPRESSPQPTLSYVEEQAALRAAERLLSRTLMNAWAESGPGGDMASELAPTQTHVYLRAPRRFAHPAWVARQNLARTLDGVLDAFLAEAGAVCPPQGNGNAKKGRGVKTEGAWIGCRGGSAFAAERASKLAQGMHQADQTGRCTDPDADEEDEEIWWAWDGKIVGFADW
ncbi:hypothetical protein ACG7TL_003377 [Trametes sanguinea]